METRRKEIFLLVLAVLMLGVAVWTFKPKSAPAPIATAVATNPVKTETVAGKPGESTATSQEGVTKEGEAQNDAVKETAIRNPFTTPGAPGATPDQAATSANSPSESGENVAPTSGTATLPVAGPTGEQQQSALTLTGILSGKPTMAVLRENDQRYFVKVGDIVGDGYRVQAINSQQVILAGQQGKLILRMGGRQ